MLPGFLGPVLYTKAMSIIKKNRGGRRIACCHPAEKLMQRIDQDCQIGFSGVARPHEHGERTQVDFGLGNRPEILHFKLKRILAF